MSSKRAVRRKQCGQKCAFATEAEARASLAYLERRNAQTGNVWRVHAYRCGFCGLWHAGHEQATEKRTRRAQFP